MCPICELEKETAAHILWTCRLSIHCWVLVENFVAISILNNNCLEDGQWITNYWRSEQGNQFFKGLIASCAWAIRKNRCKEVFNANCSNVNQLFQIVLNAMLDHSNKAKGNFRELISNSCSKMHISILTDASWIDCDNCCGLGIVILS